MLGGNIFDTLRPDLIEIGEGTTISVRCVIVSHFVKQRNGYREWSFGKVKIGKNTFNTAIEMILKDVKVGDHLRIFMTKNYYQNNDEFVLNNPTIKTKDIVIVDVLIASIK